MDADIGYIDSDENHFLTVEVAASPIGGYRGPAGTIQITPVNNKRLSQWSDSDLEKLAVQMQITMRVFEQANVSNFLVLGEDSKKGFTVTLIPYPSCSLLEKLLPSYHYFFHTAPSLSEEQIKEIATYHKEARTKNEEKSLNSPQENPPNANSEKKEDAFCQDEVIQRQLIHTFNEPQSKIDLLYDQKPLRNDHLLIVLSKEEGHFDGSQVSTEKRVHMLKVARQVTAVLEKEENEKILFIERNGKLQSVLHKHSHVIAIKKMPETFCEKVSYSFSNVRIKKLSDKEIEKQVSRWQKLLEVKSGDASVPLFPLHLVLAR